MNVSLSSDQAYINSVDAKMYAAKMETEKIQQSKLRVYHVRRGNS